MGSVTLLLDEGIPKVRAAALRGQAASTSLRPHRPDPGPSASATHRRRVTRRSVVAAPQAGPGRVSFLEFPVSEPPVELDQRHLTGNSGIWRAARRGSGCADTRGKCARCSLGAWVCRCRRPGSARAWMSEHDAERVPHRIGEDPEPSLTLGWCTPRSAQPEHHRAARPRAGTRTRPRASGEQHLQSGSPQAACSAREVDDAPVGSEDDAGDMCVKRPSDGFLNAARSAPTDICSPAAAKAGQSPGKSQARPGRNAGAARGRQQ